MALSWRSARMDDAVLLWRWANDAETRRRSFNPAPIPYTDHVAWLDGRLASAATRLWIVSDEIGPVGQLRADLADGVAEISLAVAPERRGQGLGSAMLRQALSAVAAEHQTLWIQIRDSIVLSADELLREAAALIPRLLSALLVLFIARFAARSVRTGVQRLLLRTHPDLNTQQLIRTLTYYGVWTLGWVLALGTAGIHPTALVAGLGVTTIVLGFACQRHAVIRVTQIRIGAAQVRTRANNHRDIIGELT